MERRGLGGLLFVASVVLASLGASSRPIADIALQPRIRPFIGDEHHVMPHELAHAFGLDHAACGGATAVDPWYVNDGDPSGLASSDGWDFANHTVPDGSKLADVMGYCDSHWVGAYDWEKVVKFFSTGEAANAPNAEPSGFLQPLDSSQLAIHVSVSIFQDHLAIFNSFTDFGSRFHKTTPGSVIVDGLDSAGNTAFNGTAAALIFKGTLAGGAFYDAPLSISQASRLDALRVRYRGLSVVFHALPSGPISATAVSLDSTHLKLSFDSRHFKELIVRPSATSSLDSQPIEGDGTETFSATIENDRSDVFVDFTNGIQTVARHVRIHVQGR